jgi:hypothetical protein
MGANKDQLTIMFALIAALWVWIEYRAAQGREKRTETIRYIDRYHSENYLAARSTLNTVLFDKAKKEELFDARKNKDRDKLEQFVTSNKLGNHLLALAELYGSFAQCVDASVCDRSVGCKYFASDIRGLYNTFRPVFSEIWKEMWGEDFMAEPMKFANSCLRE